MSMMDRVFDDDTPHLDQFGLLLVLTIAAVAVNALVDLDIPTANMRSELAWIIVTIVVGATLALAARASGLARRPRLVVEAFIALSVVTSIVVTLADTVVPGNGIDVTASRPSAIWAAMAFVAPLLVLRRIMVHEEVTSATLYGAVSTFLLFSLSFHYLYLSIASWIDGPFFATVEPTSTFMYFSLVTITTLGYGDFAPVGEVGRFLATAEAVIGQVFLVMIVARLVSLYGTGRAPIAPRRSDEA